MNADPSPVLPPFAARCPHQCFGLVGKQSKAATQVLEARTNEPLRKETLLTCADTGQALHSINKRYITLREQKVALWALASAIMPLAVWTGTTSRGNASDEGRGRKPKREEEEGTAPGSLIDLSHPLFSHMTARIRWSSATTS